MTASSSGAGVRIANAIGRAWQSPLLQWLMLSALWIALAVISAAQNVAWRDLEWRIAFGFSLLDWGPWILLSPLVLWFARRVQIDARNWLRTVPLHIGGAVVVAVSAHLMVQLAIDYRIFAAPEGGPRVIMRGPGDRRGPSSRGERPPPTSERRPPERDLSTIARYMRARFSIPIYCVLVAAAHAAAYHRRSLERERRALAAEARLTEARLMALQTQLNPHFLFNTLNAISALVYTQPHAADEMICALSELLRRVLALADRREVTLAEELEFVDRYLQIQRIRFSDKLDVRREIAPGLEHALVPTLILQPLAENAIIHGIAPHAARGTVTIRAAAREGRLVLAVSDTGGSAPGEPVRGHTSPRVTERIGLTNSRARLAALYGDDARLTLSPAPEGGVCAQLDLPLRQPVVA